MGSEMCIRDRDARQDEKQVPDLLEAIVQPPGLVKEELRPILFKMTQFRPEITKIHPKSQKSGFDPKVKSSKMGLSMDPCRFLKRPTHFRDIWPRQGPNRLKQGRKNIMGISSFGAGYPSPKTRIFHVLGMCGQWVLWRLRLQSS